MGFDAKLLQRFDIQVRAITGGTGLVLLVASCINLIVSLLDSFSPKTLILSTYTRYPSRSHLTPRTTLTLTRSPSITHSLSRSPFQLPSLAQPLALALAPALSLSLLYTTIITHIVQRSLPSCLRTIQCE